MLRLNESLRILFTVPAHLDLEISQFDVNLYGDLEQTVFIKIPTEMKSCQCFAKGMQTP